MAFERLGELLLQVSHPHASGPRYRTTRTSASSVSLP
jgi:hypothetical protein